MPSAKKKQQQQQKQSNDANKHSNPHTSISNANNSNKGANTSASTTTTNTTSPNAANNKLQVELAEEQSRLYQELNDYISQFRTKAKAKSKLSSQELIILFVMHLHARWKRLVEPEEYRFKDWEEAAKVAQYHAIKYSVLLGAERFDHDPMFTSKTAKKTLSSGYFKPSFTPSSSSSSTRDSHNNITQDVAKDKTSNSKTKMSTDKVKSKRTSSESQQKEEIPVFYNGTQFIIEDDTSTAKEQSSSATTTSDRKEEQYDTKKQEEDPTKDEKGETTSFLTHTEQRGKLIIPAGANKQSVCYKVPSAHKNVNLPFIDLSINGQRVRRCLLAKKRWGASAMSIALQEDLGLKLNRQDACDIATEFGQVEDAIGSVLCLIQHPSSASMESELTIQVMPALYGGKVDLILGADFFFFFGAHFKLKQSMIHFMGYDAPFYADTFE